MSKASSTIYAEQAAFKTRARKASVEAAPSTPSIGRTFERFLELPAAFVLFMLWLAGVAMLGSVVLAVYAVVSALMWSW